MPGPDFSTVDSLAGSFTTTINLWGEALDRT
jgi:hypothetical protein